MSYLRAEKPLASVIMTTYNAPKHLALALASMQIQTTHDFELHIADDGSSAETSQLVEDFIDRAPFSVVYSWQADLGYRKTKILNEAIRKSRGDYLIFVDGDCIQHKDFVRNHLKYRQKNCYLAGRRVELGPSLSEWVTPEMVLRGQFSRPNLQVLLSCLKKDSAYFHRSFALYNPTLRRVLRMEKVDDLKGCNFSVDRESMMKINGFDEDYVGYSREDTDVELRLQALGLKIKSLKGLALQYHVWHPRLSEDGNNIRKLHERYHLVRESAVCKNGIVKY